MKCYAVIDTNVLVSALLSRKNDAATVLVVQKLISGEIIPVYSNAITNKYRDVLQRKKFHFESTTVDYLINAIEKFGLLVDLKHLDIVLPDIKDLPFYEVVMEERDKAAYLVSGNMKHFPIEPFIVTTSQLLNTLEEVKMKNRKNDKIKSVENSRPCIKKMIRIDCLIVTVIFLLDGFNMPSYIAQNIMNNINWSLWPIVISTILTVSLFYATYVLVDKYQKQRAMNKETTAKYLIALLYNDYEETMYVLGNDMLKDKINSSVDFDQPVNNSELFINLTKSSDIQFESLKSFLLDGTLGTDIVEDVYRIRSNFNSFVSFAITFFDHPEAYKELRSGLLKDIRFSKEKLNVSEINRGDYFKLKVTDNGNSY